MLHSGMVRMAGDGSTAEMADKPRSETDWSASQLASTDRTALVRCSMHHAQQRVDRRPRVHPIARFLTGNLRCLKTGFSIT